MRSAKELGTPLPAAFRQLESMGAILRRGQLSLVAASPAGGKPALASFIALHQDYSGEGDMVPTLYFSADSDEMTFGGRATAGVIEKDLSTTMRLLEEGDEQTWRAQEAATEHMWIDWNPSPSLDDIAEEVEAYAYAVGDFPHFIVVDNLMNVDSGGSSMEMSSLYDAMNGLHILARETGAHVMVLHHVTGAFEDGNIPIPRSGIMGKVSKLPRLILTLHKPAGIEDMLAVSVVKNSNGPQDPTGVGVCAYIPWMPARSWMGDGR